MKGLWTLTLVLAALAASASWSAEHMYKKAKVGQWTEYKTVSEMAGTKSELKMKTTVTAKDETSITLTIVTEMGGQKLPEQTSVIKFEDLDAPHPEVKTEELEKGSESVTAAGKSYACNWVKNKVTSETEQSKSVTLAKSWTSDDVPLGGLVKMESNSSITVAGNEMKTVSTMELIGCGP
ncbi:MAG: hypothetical protein HS116_04270 [Planctomycetes bacterium]|nr:hypothetical protein [Planctomycetota bacterium]